MIDLNALSTKTLVELFNLVSEKPTKKFESKEAGITRLCKALVADNSEVFQSAEGEYDIRPIDHASADANEVPSIAERIEDNSKPADLPILANALNTMLGAPKAKKSVGRSSPLVGKKLTLVREANPKREKSRTHVRYEIYRECKTSDDFIRICLERNLGTKREIMSDLAWDSSQQFIKLS